MDKFPLILFYFKDWSPCSIPPRLSPYVVVPRSYWVAFSDDSDDSVEGELHWFL